MFLKKKNCSNGFVNHNITNDGNIVCNVNVRPPHVLFITANGKPPYIPIICATRSVPPFYLIVAFCDSGCPCRGFKWSKFPFRIRRSFRVVCCQWFYLVHSPYLRHNHFDRELNRFLLCSVVVLFVFVRPSAPPLSYYVVVVIILCTSCGHDVLLSIFY